MSADPNTISHTSSQDPCAGGRQVFTKPEVVRVGPERSIKYNLWLQRIRALLFVTVCATLGVLLVILPWTAKWTENPLLLMSSHLRGIALSGFARGISSGLGMLDLWLGFWEAIHYHENPKVHAS
ncbi:MAG: hypothetical protein JO356_13495 [Acidobacteria bacterium]|nr:hypothetical protein [Acidobacteriota bacterium]